MDKLRQQGLEENTVIYFSTDQAAHVEEVAQGSKVFFTNCCFSYWFNSNVMVAITCFAEVKVWAASKGASASPH